MQFVPMPNGQGGINLMPVYSPQETQEVTAYEGFYTTEGVEVQVSYKTSNKAIVDSIEKKLLDSGWKLSENKETEMGPWAIWFTLLVVTFFGALAFVGVLLCGAVFAELGNFITFSELDSFMILVIRTSIIGFLIFNSASTIYLILAKIKEYSR